MNCERLKPVWAAARHQVFDASKGDMSKVCGAISCLFNYVDRRIRLPSLHQAADLVSGNGRAYSQQCDKLCEASRSRADVLFEKYLASRGQTEQTSQDPTMREERTEEGSSRTSQSRVEVLLKEYLERRRHTEKMSAATDTEGATDSEELIRGEFTRRSPKRRNEDQDEVPLKSHKRSRMLSTIPEEDSIEMAQADESSRLTSKFTQTLKSAVQNENYKRLLRRRGSDINLDETLPLAITLVFDTNSRLPIKTIISNVHPDIRKF